MKRNTWAIVFGLCLLCPALLYAAQPNLIHYQARIQDSAQEDIDGPVTVHFNIYDSLSGSTILWGETQALTAVEGIISLDLGAVDPLPQGLFSNPELYLGISAAGDPEMMPRPRLVSTWKAMSVKKAAGKAVQAGGGTLTLSSASSGSESITFADAFQAPPVVMLGAPSDTVGGIIFIPTRVTDVTSTGCTAHFTSLDGSPATGSATFDWIAIGK